MGCNVQDQSTGTAVSSSATVSATYGPAIIYPMEPKDKTEIKAIRDRLDEEGLGFVEIKSDALGFTAFFWVASIEKTALEALETKDEVDFAYYYEDYLLFGEAPPEPPENDPAPGSSDLGFQTINKRANSPSVFWELSQISTPKGVDWYRDFRIRDPDVSSPDAAVDYVYYYHESAGEGQYVYIVEDGIWDKHPEFQGQRIEHIHGEEYADDFFIANQNLVDHGSGVTAKVIGKELGIAKQATAIILDRKSKRTTLAADKYVAKKLLEALLNAADDIATKGRSGKSVVNMSFGMTKNTPPAFIDMFRKSCFSVLLARF